MTVQQLSDRLLELSHQYGLAQAKVGFVRNKELVTVDDIYVLNNNIIVFCAEMEAIILPKDTELPRGDWVVRDKEPL